MKISVSDVKYIARLAKLCLTEEQTEKMAKEFEGILSHFENIDRVDLTDVGSELFNEQMTTVLRKDEVRVFEEREKLFRNTKSMRGSYIEVPKIME